jgi:DNA-binding NarL/FixJ family response regulator
MQQLGDQQKYGRVLLADKHHHMLEGIRSLLESLFDVVVMVADEKSLFDSLEKVNPDVVTLPISEKMNVSRCIKKRNPEMKVIILSVHDEQIAVEECLSSGAEGFVLKRSASNDLMPAIREVLKGRTYVSPSVNAEV